MVAVMLGVLVPLDMRLLRKRVLGTEHARPGVPPGLTGGGSVNSSFSLGPADWNVDCSRSSQ